MGSRGIERGRLTALAVVVVWAAACAPEAPSAPVPDAAPAPLILEGPHPAATIEMQGLGSIEIELLPELAPRTVELFTRLADEGFYDGTTFHRVIPGFMIQGGDPNTRNDDPRDDGKGGSGLEFPDEFSGIPTERGLVAMANRGSPNSAAGQFFIVHGDSRHLDGRYTIFGRVVSGIETVDAVTELEIDTYGRYGPQNRPYPEDARMRSVRVRPPEAP